MSLIKLFLLFTKIGAILLGGGYVILPILQSEFVDKRKLISQDDLIDYYALSQSLPGIVAANISIFIGYKLKGKLGALTAMLGVIFVPFVSIILLASFLSIMTENKIIQNIFFGISVAVAVLIILTVKEIWQKTNKTFFFYFLFILTLIGLLIFKLTPIQSIIIFSIAGMLIKMIQRRFLN